MTDPRSIFALIRDTEFNGKIPDWLKEPYFFVIKRQLRKNNDY